MENPEVETEQNPILTIDNIDEWKKKIDKIMLERYQMENFSNSLEDYDWIENHEGKTVEQVIEREICYWEE
jgi:hypothetical protein